MKSKILIITGMILLLVLVPVSVLASPRAAPEPVNPEKLAALGEFLYFDTNLSEPDGQACAGCHEPTVGFDDPDVGLPVSEGVVPGMFGGRNSPISAYAMYSPVRYFDDVDGLWIGGAFWDSRATGDVLGDPLADQALGPFLAEVEMHNPDMAAVVTDVAASSYSGLFEEVWGVGSLDNVPSAYNMVALSIAAFERSQLFGQFSSKYDAYLAACIAAGGDMNDCAVGSGSVAEKVGNKLLTKKEWDGMQLFMGDAMCVACHVADWTAAADYDLPVQVPAWAPEGMVPPLFTDFTYDNLGIPKSDDKLLAGAPVDLGLGFRVNDSAENGKFKVMTVRNSGMSAPYGHNGYFKHLKDIVHFYNTRDVPSEMWPVPEYPDTVNTGELGNLGLSDKDEDALVKFMNTLSDGYIP